MNKSSTELLQPVRQHMEAYLNQWMDEHNSGFSERLRHMSSALYRMEEELERCEESELAQLAHTGADSIEKICGEIDQGDARDLLGVLERQGQEHPAGAFLASMAAGFLSSRALRYRNSNTDDAREASGLDPEFSRHPEPSTLETEQAQNISATQPVQSEMRYAEGGDYGQDKS